MRDARPSTIRAGVVTYGTLLLSAQARRFPRGAERALPRTSPAFGGSTEPIGMPAGYCVFPRMNFPDAISMSKLAPPFPYTYVPPPR